MTISQFLGQSASLLVDSSLFATTAILSTPTAFGISSTNASALATSASLVSARYDDVVAAKLAYEAAVKAQQMQREAFGTLFTTLLNQSYANPAVTDVSLISIGLDARSSRQARPVRQPLNLKVVPNENGFINASWKRNQNTSATTFNLEMLSSEGEWELIWAGARIRIELSGFTPGETQSFRVVATKGGETSLPSNIWTIYPDGGALGFRVAA